MYYIPQIHVVVLERKLLITITVNVKEAMDGDANDAHVG